MRTVHSTIQELKARRSEMVQQIGFLDEAIRSLERVIQAPVVKTENRPTPKPTNRRGPGTSEAILTILEEAGRPLKDTEILRAMEAKGWAPPSRTPLNALRASLSRLRRDERIRRRERDRAYHLPTDSEASREQEASDPLSNQGGHMDPP